MRRNYNLQLRLATLSFAWLSVAALASQAKAADLACKPKIEGPIAATAASDIYTPHDAGALPAGMVVREYFVSCSLPEGVYKTVLHVTTPADPKRQSGVVIAEPWHPGDHYTVYSKTRNYIARQGHTSVVIAASSYVLDNFLKKIDPERYDSLHIPGKAARMVVGSTDMTESEILGQVGALLKSGAIPGLKIDKVILGGMSQTGGVVRKYIGYEHRQPKTKSVYDGYFPEQSAIPSYDAPMPDLDVPVVELQGERELIVTFERNFDHLKFRRPDGPLYRLYEVPGMPHIDTRGHVEEGIKECDAHPWTDFPTDMVYAASLNNLIDWVKRDIPAPHIPRVQTSKDGRTILRDSYENALGGYRTTYFDVPIATYHGTWGQYQETPSGPTDAIAQKCNMIGWTSPLSAETLRKLYPTHAAYVTKVTKDAGLLVQSRQLLPEDAAILRAEAERRAVP